MVLIATKSGTNQFHGGAFWFVRNYDLNAKDWFSTTVDPLKRNQYGGFVGGPIMKDKLFFFGNYQGTRQITASTDIPTNTPTAAMLTGDFSGFATTPGVTNLAGPFKTIGALANQLDTSIASLNAAAVTIATTGLPGHTAGVTQGANGSMRYVEAPAKNVYNEYTGKLDYDISPSQRVTLRSFTNHMTAPSGDTPGNMLSVINDQNWTYNFAERMDYFNDVLTHSWTINPTMVNTVSVF